MSRKRPSSDKSSRPAPPAKASPKVSYVDSSAGLAMPKYDDDDESLDLLAAIPGEYTLNPGAKVVIPTGVSVDVPKGFEIAIRRHPSASETAKVLTSPLDHGDEIGVCLFNDGDHALMVRRGMPVAQLVLAPEADDVPAEADPVSDTKQDAGEVGSASGGGTDISEE